MKSSKVVALVAPHFPPSNLAGVHRARLLSQHLHEFGWRPIIVTTHWRHYEESLDWGLASLVDPSLEIISTPALPTRPARIVGDIGIRALPWHLAALRRLRREKRIDFIHITVPSFYSAMLGQFLHIEESLPFGIDYIDPWVHTWPGSEVKYSKAWASMKLGEKLEPWAVRNAALITGVAEGYYAGVLARNPRLKQSCVTAAMPYGHSTLDFSSSGIKTQKLSLFDPNDGMCHLVYAGALLPKARIVLERFLLGLACLRETSPEIANRIRVHFIGTGKSPEDPNGHNVQPMAAVMGVSKLVTEYPRRMGYLDVLAHLAQAYGVLIIGSIEPHYTPSKVFQAVQSKRPVFALLHGASTAIEILEKSGAGVAIPLSERALPEPARIASRLQSFVEDRVFSPERVRWGEFDTFSARESARQMADALSEALEAYAFRAK
jgi:hypothetical protein